MATQEVPAPKTISTATPLQGQQFYLIGVGGAGMSVLAQLLAQQGAQVSGSDISESANVQTLRRLGMEIHLGHDAAQVPEKATVIVSTAVKATNPELVAARARGQKVLHRSQGLALAAQGKRFVAVAGTHGKTTTSGMLAAALTELGYDPSFAVGGIVQALHTGAHVGAGDVFIAEADESDRSFLNYTPSIELVTNVEPDHLDSFGTQAAFEAAFADFAARLRPEGLLVACSDDAGSLRLAQSRAAAGQRVVTYGAASPQELPGGALVGNEHVQLEIVQRSGTQTRSVLTRWVAGNAAPCLQCREELVILAPGDHVALDAAGAWATGLELGVGGADMARALHNFAGTKRRFEFRGEVAGVRVIDDYAHHPTEIEALLQAGRVLARARSGRVLLLFQPHLFSRTLTFASRFRQVLALADLVVVTAIYPAREDPADFPDVSGNLIASFIPGARYIASGQQAALALASAAQRGDVIFTVGAGDVTQLADVILEYLQDNAVSAAGHLEAQQ